VIFGGSLAEIRQIFLFFPWPFFPCPSLSAPPPCLAPFAFEPPLILQRTPLWPTESTPKIRVPVPPFASWRACCFFLSCVITASSKASLFWFSPLLLPFDFFALPYPFPPLRNVCSFHQQRSCPDYGLAEKASVCFSLSPL